MATENPKSKDSMDDRLKWAKFDRLKREGEFNLSEKGHKTLVSWDEPEIEGERIIFLEEDVKEFIKRLKEEFPISKDPKKPKDYRRGEIIDKIDKIFGEELSK